MSLRGCVAATAVIVVASAAQAGAVPVADGKIAGRVATDLRPQSGSIVFAQAIDASNLTVAASGRVTRAGSYKLSVPPGIYLVAAQKTSRTVAATGYSRLVRVRSRSSVSPPKIARRPQSAALGASAGRPALAVKEFTTTPPGLHGGNLARMVQTHLSIFRDPCVTVVDWIGRSNVLDEIRLQQSKSFDPATRVRPNLTQPTIFVEGSVSTNASSISWNIRMREIKSDRVVASDSGSVPWSRYLDVSEDIAKRLLEQLDADCFPDRIEGSFTGELKVAGSTTFTGKIRFQRDEKQSSKGIVGYRVARVEFTTTIGPPPGCQGRATEMVTLTNVNPQVSKLVISKHRTAGKGYSYFVVSSFQSPRTRQITITCNGAPATIPWVPAAALNTGSNKFTLDGSEFKGLNKELAPNTYTWDLRGSG